MMELLILRIKSGKRGKTHPVWGKEKKERKKKWGKEGKSKELYSPQKETILNHSINQ